jgi:hypothetical protein
LRSDQNKEATTAATEENNNKNQPPELLPIVSVKENQNIKNLNGFLNKIAKTQLARSLAASSENIKETTTA